MLGVHTVFRADQLAAASGKVGSVGLRNYVNKAWHKTLLLLIPIALVIWDIWLLSAGSSTFNTCVIV